MATENHNTYRMQVQNSNNNISHTVPHVTILYIPGLGIATRYLDYIARLDFMAALLAEAVNIISSLSVVVVLRNVGVPCIRIGMLHRACVCARVWRCYVIAVAERSSCV